MRLLFRDSLRGLVIFSTVLMVAEGAEPVNFSRQIRPILADNCFACHGPDENHREAELRLDLEESAKEHVITPGNAGESELVARITSTDEDERMPPPDSKKSLEPDEIELLTRWIDEGAVWSKHWAFESVVRPELPEVSESQWPRNEIDRFVLARMKAEGLTPAEETDRRTYIRRVSFDLIGLPPTPDEVEAFLADRSEQAYENLVDRLLSSAHYGERMAVQWLDGARYADTNGYQNDFFRKQWIWRDWVIQTFNDNMPYDQFVVEQLAGDLLPDPSESQLIATGFNRNNRSVTEAGSLENEWFVENVIDRVETTSTVFLGLSMGCARCHTHKYDPITHQDFYRFYAFFNNVDEKGVYTETRGNVGPQVKLLSDENRERLAEFDQQIAAVKQQIETAKDEESANLDTFLSETLEAIPATELPLPMVSLPFDGDLAIATDTETALPDARLNGGEANWIPGPLGSALQLDENSEVIVERPAIKFAPDRPFTVSAWVQPESVGAVFSKMDDGSAYRGVDLIVLKDGKVEFHLVDAWPGNAVVIATKKPIPLETWQHLCATYDGSGKADGVKVYVDGLSVDIEEVSDNLAADGRLETAEPLRIGRRSQSLPLTGAVSQFALYDAALSREQAAGLWKQGLEQAIAATEGGTVDQREDATGREQREILTKYAGRIMLRDLQSQLAKVEREQTEYDKSSVPSVMVMKDREEYRPTFLLRRGEYDKQDESEELWPSVPSFLPQLPESAPKNRLGLAQWLVSREHPLTSRTIVNRLWARFFGRGIVASVDNFGLQSAPPSHPELLDWLSADLMENGWDLKRLQKQIVLSAAYRQSSAVTAEKRSQDPQNVWLARAPRLRLPAELIRDNALEVSGLLVDRIGGPSVRPYQPAGLWEELAGGANDGPYKMDEGEGLYRRSLYTYRKRTVGHPTLGTFDAPTWETCYVQRAITNTPLQALALLNDPTYVEAGRKLAERMLNETEGDPRQRIAWAYKLVTCREIDPQRLEWLTAAYDRYREQFEASPAQADDYLSIGASPIDDRLPATDLAAYALVGSTLLNLDETITRE